MNKIERDELKEKLVKYDTLTKKVGDIERMLNLPSYVRREYKGQEKSRINMSFTFGNGTSRYEVTINEDDYAFKEITKALLKEKEVIEELINNL